MAGKHTVNLLVELTSFPSTQPIITQFDVSIEVMAMYKPPYFKPNLPANITIAMLNNKAEAPYDFTYLLPPIVDDYGLKVTVAINFG